MRPRALAPQLKRDPLGGSTGRFGGHLDTGTILLIIVVGTTILLIIVVGTSIWVFFDATSIGVKKGQVAGLANMGPGGWLIASLLLWIIAFPLYLAYRGKFKAANQKSS